MTRPRVRVGLALSLLAVSLPSWADGPTGRGSQEQAVATLLATVADQASQIAALKQQVEVLRASVDGQALAIGRTARAVRAIEDSPAMKMNPYLEVTTEADVVASAEMPPLPPPPLPVIRWTGVNLQLVNGAGPGATEAELRSPDTNGLGNLILGYNEQRSVIGEPLAVRTGSHHLVIGPLHAYEGASGIVSGFKSTIDGNHVNVTGGEANTADGNYTSISGGESNHVRGLYGSITGGGSNYVMQDAHRASIAGGGFNKANNGYATVSGGKDNLAEGGYSNVSGGASNHTKGSYASVCGGFDNNAWGNYSSVSGGRDHFIEYFANYSSISGGTSINILTPDTWAAGGFFWP